MKKASVTLKLNKPLIERVVKAGSRKALWSALDYLAAQSKEQVPLNKGPLHDSCYVDVAPDGSGGTVSYDKPYAVRWHEHDANFQRGRKKKYLEDPLNDPSVQANMMKLAQSAFESEIG